MTNVVNSLVVKIPEDSPVLCFLHLKNYFFDFIDLFNEDVIDENKVQLGNELEIGKVIFSLVF